MKYRRGSDRQGGRGKEEDECLPLLGSHFTHICHSYPVLNYEEAPGSRVPLSCGTLLGRLPHAPPHPLDGRREAGSCADEPFITSHHADVW